MKWVQLSPTLFYIFHTLSVFLKRNLYLNFLKHFNTQKNIKKQPGTTSYIKNSRNKYAKKYKNKQVSICTKCCFFQKSLAQQNQFKNNFKYVLLRNQGILTILFEEMWALGQSQYSGSGFFLELVCNQWATSALAASDFPKLRTRSESLPLKYTF